MSQFSLICDTSLNYKIKKPIRLIELFAGIGSQAKALKNIKVDFETYKVVEIDPYALKSYNTIHNTNFEVQDITKINPSDLCIVDTNKYEYILTYSFPCQDLSLAGKQKGMGKGGSTRSGLLWEVERLLKGCIELPQILLMENVPQVVGKANIKDFMQWTKCLNKLGYKNYFKLLNAKDYGVPQNRNRCFMVSILGDYNYLFPPKQKLELRLKDLLEDNVDEKYYLSEKMINYISANNEKWTGNNGMSLVNKSIASTINTNEGCRRCDASNYISSQLKDNCNIKEVMNLYNLGLKKYNRRTGSVVDPNNISSTLLARTQGDNNLIAIKNATKQGYIMAEDGDGVDISGRMEYHRGTVQKGMAQTIKTSNDVGVAVSIKEDNLRIRKLTPRECWRLMGFSDEDFDKASKVCSNTQLYKQAGNSIVVNVLEEIFKMLLG